jgi:5'-deoxynucleotidase YfbR-like HD superfamily hydrolase
MKKSLEELLKECTVKLTLPNNSGWGTGFFVSPGKIITCSHVLNNFTEQIKVQWQGQLIAEAVVKLNLRTASNPLDLALLECELSQDKIPPCVWLDQTVASYHDLYIYGYSDNFPDGEPITTQSEGITIEQNTRIIKFKAGQIRPGISGSPVLNTKTGKVCGIVSDTRKRNSDWGGLAISVAEMFNHWDWLKDENLRFHQQNDCWSKVINQHPQEKTPKPKFAENLPISDEDELNRLKKFVQKTTLDQDDKSIELTNFINNLPNRSIKKDSPFDSIILKGSQGAGKTTFLSVLYSYLESQYSPRYRQLTPLYINLTDFIGIDENERQSIKKSVDNFEGFISQNNDCQFFLMVDGLTARANYLSTYLTSQILDIDFNNIDAIIWTVSDEFDKEIQKLIKDKKNPDFPEYRQKNIQVDSVEVNDSEIDDYLRLFIILHNKIYNQNVKNDLISKEIDLLKEKIQELKINRVDQYILSIIYQKLNADYYRSIRAIGRYLEKYCQDKFELEKPELLEDIAFLSYKLVVESFYLKPENQPPTKLQTTDSDRKNKYWRFLIEHKVIRDFLAIWFVIRLIHKAGLGRKLEDEIKNSIDSNLIAYDFPESMNKYSRDLIDNLPSDGRSFITGIDRILSHIVKTTGNIGEINNSQTINILCYFLGRSPNGFLDRSQKILDRLVNKSQCNQILNDTNNKDIDDKCRISLKTQYRTISVSYIKLRGASSTSKEFLLQLLRDKEMASIDRGYHRIYYGDAQPYKDTVPYCYQDSQNLNWSNSFLALKKCICEEFSRLSVEPQDFLKDNKDNIVGINTNSSDEEDDELISIPYKLQHLIFTLVSFVQSRRNSQSNRYLNEEHIHFSSKVVGYVLSKRDILIDLKQYFETFLIDLERKHTSWNFIIDLYRLKWTPRRGWLKRNLDNFYLGRIESVADHTLFTVYLAHFLLPNYTEDYPEYNKRIVKDILTFHDVLEVYTGDFIPYYMDNIQKSKANELSDNALAYIRYKDNYENLNETNQIFDNCKDFSKTYLQSDSTASINAKVARGIDKLENFIQLYIYRDLYKESITQDVFNEFYENLVKGIKEVPIVNELLDDFIAWEENNSNCNNLFDFSSVPFRDDNLLVSNESIFYTENSDRTQTPTQ